MDKVALANITITSIVNGFAIKSHSYDRTVIEPKSPLSSRSIKDAADFGWVKRWVAIGDSFTAGIGAGRPYSQSKSDRSCSRYDLAYPAVLNRLFGSVVQDSQYIACSGDRSVQIYEQAKALKGDLNLVVLTAGGNDLCLVNFSMKRSVKENFFELTSSNSQKQSLPAYFCRTTQKNSPRQFSRRHKRTLTRS